jgi:hypothetical protein
MSTSRLRPPNQWQPGQTGNPKGRPPGQSAITKMRTSLAGDVPGILANLVAAAKGGDVQAARLILERVLPPLKGSEQPQAMSLPDGSLADQGRAVLRAVAAGVIAPTQGAALLGAIGTLARVVEVDELASRIENLEKKNGKS